MANYATIQRQIDQGLGVGARHIGQPYTGYRVAAGATGDFPTGWDVVLADGAFYRQPATGAKLEWGFKSSSVKFYDLIGNVSALVLGDVLLQTDTLYGPGATLWAGTQQIQALGLAWHYPVGVPIGAWLNSLARLYRPNETPTLMSDGSSYWASTHDQDQGLVLANGVFRLGTRGTRGSLIPVGLSASERSERGQLFPPSTPGMTPPVRYYGYIPPLVGYTPKEGDALITVDGARYVIVHPFRQEVGVVGSNLYLERTTSQV